MTTRRNRKSSKTSFTWSGLGAALILVLLLCAGPGAAVSARNITAAAATKPPINAGIRKSNGLTFAGAEFGEGNVPGVYGHDYIYPTDRADYSVFCSKGLTNVRIPFRWERLQRTFGGALHGPDLKLLKAAVSSAGAAGCKVTLDLHNFGRYHKRAVTASLPNMVRLASFWASLATEMAPLKKHIYGFELMNEPNDLPGKGAWWYLATQLAITEIRKRDATTRILVPGYSWQSSRRWRFPDNNEEMFRLKGGNLLFSAHQYFDQDESGTYVQAYEPGRDAQTFRRSDDFLKWLGEHKVDGIITEVGVPGDDAGWLSVLDKYYARVATHPRIAGTLLWAAGPWWPAGTRLTVYSDAMKPRLGGQMKVISKYRSSA
jgi:endoglucanase